MVLRSLIRTFVGMKYFLIAGEASGDLHARHLMDAIRNNDARAEIRYWYRPDLAYMGFISVAMHLSEILRGMQECKKNILEFDEEKYAADCKAHYQALGGSETGKAAQLVAQRIYQQCFG